MTNEQWHTAVDPKVEGTWNIHNALLGKDAELDFFLMTSSISGSVGTATEANYCAGNYFLDLFARKLSSCYRVISSRWKLVESSGRLPRRRKFARLPPFPRPPRINHDYGYDEGVSAHILTGLEPIELQRIRKKGFEGSYPGLSDPRSAVLSRSLRSTSQGSKGGVETRGHGDLPPEVASALDAGVPLGDAVRAHVMRRFGSLVLIAFERVDAHRPLDAYGMDSMVGAEFRSWFYKAFGVDVPFPELLGKATTLDGLSKKIVSEIEKRR